MVLELSYILKKYFHYEVLIFTCTSNLTIESTTWLGGTFFYSSGCGYQQWSYKDEVMSVYQYPMQSCTLNDYREMFKKIYEFNPIYVLNAGVNNPIADLPCDFTTVVVRNMSTKLPVSEANIMVRAGSRITRNKDENMLGMCQEQILWTQNSVIVNTTDHKFTRRELRLPDNKF